MSRFVSKKTKRIDLGNEEFVDVRESLSFTEIEPIALAVDPKNPSASTKMAIPLLKLAITGWHILDDNNAPVPYSKDRIGDLDMETVTKLVADVSELYFPEKKNSEQSKESSLAEAK